MTTWCKLVHVCQRWRHIVFSSPHRLDLRILCREGTPVRGALDVWPALPITIRSYGISDGIQDDMIATLENRSQVQVIILNEKCLPFERFVMVMQEPFPALECLDLRYSGAGALPDTFLGGSAPRLRSLSFSPETMATSVSALAKLTHLEIDFEGYAFPYPFPRIPPPLTCAVLPVFTSLRFEGLIHYLEDFVARIDAPLFDNVTLMLVCRLGFDIQQLTRFISHAPILMCMYSREMMGIRFSHGRAMVDVHPLKSVFPFILSTTSWREADQQVSSMAQIICSQLAIVVCGIARLDIDYHPDIPSPPGDMDDTQWKKNFRPFTFLRTLCLKSQSPTSESFIVSMPRGLSGETATKVLPALDNLYLVRSHSEAYHPSEYERQHIQQFITARQHSNHPVTVHYYGLSPSS
jgi:hypothetical protein